MHMHYKVQTGDLSGGVIKEAEKVVRGATIQIASPTLLDEQTWNAIVAGPAVEGYIEFDRVRDETHGINYYLADLPARIDLGVSVKARANFCNPTDYPYEATGLLEFIDPDSISRGKRTETWTVDLRSCMTVSTESIVLDKVGTWKIHAVMGV